jgi:3-oxoacyl-[acyl-carrier protein] reductase
MDLNLKNKRALVLASSSGIGKAIAKALIDEGAKVAITSSNKERIEKTENEIGAKASFVCNLKDPKQIPMLIESTMSALGGIDILVTNTGGPAKGQFEELTSEQWQTEFQSILLSVVASIKGVLPVMKKQKSGRIILITSTAAKEPILNLTLSNIFRPALLGLTNTLSKEIAAHGITINTLLPGLTQTGRTAKGFEELIKKIPAKRIGQPEELAAFATFLASDKSAYITGQAISVDGGLLNSI